MDNYDGKKKNEITWEIFKIHHQRSRYIYLLFKQKKISKELYQFCIDEKIADGKLIAKWKKVIHFFFFSQIDFERFDYN